MKVQNGSGRDRRGGSIRGAEPFWNGLAKKLRGVRDPARG